LPRAELARTEDWYDPEDADNVVHNFTADVTVDGVNAGSIKAEVINREGLNMNFHEVSSYPTRSMMGRSVSDGDATRAWRVPHAQTVPHSPEVVSLRSGRATKNCK